VTLHAVPGASPKPCRSTNAMTVLIYALRDHFGSAQQRGAQVQSVAAGASG
jgi:hypothetical protein